MVNGVIGAGIFTLPAAVALLAGPAAPAAYILCAIIMAGIVICFAEAGSRVPTSGGAYGTVEAAFGPAAGFVTGMLLLASDALASAGVAAAITDMLGAVGLHRVALLLAIYATVAGINLLPVRQTTRLITAGTALKLLPLLLFVIVALAAFGVPPPPGPSASAVTLGGLGRAMILTQFAYSGLETPICASGEIRNPAHTLPRALFLAMLFILVLYIVVQVGAQHLLGAGLSHSTKPLADGAARISPLAGYILFAGAGVSMLIYLTSDVLGMSRLLFAFGRDRRLPSWLGRLHRRTHVPVNAVAIYVSVAFLLAIYGNFLDLVSQSTLAVIGVYALVCVAALRLRQRDVRFAGVPLDFPGLKWAAFVGLAGMAAMVAAAKPVEIAWLVGVSAASLAAHAITVRARAASVGG